jgi:hypothetical protein
MIILPAVAIGERAARILAGAAHGEVLALTSRGIFVRYPAGEVLFISFEAWRGPLTINLRGDEEHPARRLAKDAAPFEKVAPGEGVTCLPGCMRFSGVGFQVDVRGVSPWRTGALANEGIAENLMSRALRVAERMLGDPEQQGWLRMLPEVLQHAGPRLRDPDSNRFGEDGLNYRMCVDEGRGAPETRPDAFAGSTGGQPQGLPLQEDLLEEHRNYPAPIEGLLLLARGLRVGDTAAVIAGARGILGHGNGLTPSGDDVICGMLLVMAWRGHVEAFREICAAARETTTSLSACLIESAFEGQADERLVLGLEGLLSGTGDENALARLFRAYGSSSGGDALLGMIIAAMI